ncbi:hypothetical protein SUGI_0548900 [Cryptomeria japonica]|nr:hypothetical protein SUGI_0548900 [Cryptomeria japonica]
MPVDDVLVETIDSCGTVVSWIYLLASADLEDVTSSDALEALTLLAREKHGTHSFSRWAIVVESPYSFEPLVKCLTKGTHGIHAVKIQGAYFGCRLGVIEHIIDEILGVLGRELTYQVQQKVNAFLVLLGHDHVDAPSLVPEAPPQPLFPDLNVLARRFDASDDVADNANTNHMPRTKELEDTEEWQGENEIQLEAMEE